jgi:hypothetical protein
MIFWFFAFLIIMWAIHWYNAHRRGKSLDLDKKRRDLEEFVKSNETKKPQK